MLQQLLLLLLLPSYFLPGHGDEYVVGNGPQNLHLVLQAFTSTCNLADPGRPVDLAKSFADMVWTPPTE